MEIGQRNIKSNIKKKIYIYNKNRVTKVKHFSDLKYINIEMMEDHRQEV